ncbi:MAG: hypothetical protein LUG93_13710 [Lachnospiraceae bacterium]|nr:hypothetical protein [Lachnospiraceae bacterium]
MIKDKKRWQEFSHNIRDGFKRILTVAPLTALTIQTTAHATSVVTQINSLSSFVLSIIQAAGVIVTAWGVFEFANGYQSHDGTQQTSALKRIIAGLIMVGAGTLMSMLGVS